METHSIHPDLLRRRVRVLVVGCGATGSAVVAGLPYLHQALIACGHPGGLHVTVMDGDLISPTNCVRQPFSRFESGHYKAVVLVNRLNLFWNLGWEALPEHLSGKEPLDRIDVVIGCVDTRASRAVIRDRTSGWSTVAYVLDIGNTSDSGQFILGEPLNQVNRRSRTRLRTVFELYPESVDGSRLEALAARSSKWRSLNASRSSASDTAGVTRKISYRVGWHSQDWPRLAT